MMATNTNNDLNARSKGANTVDGQHKQQQQFGRWNECGDHSNDNNTRIQVTGTQDPNKVAVVNVFPNLSLVSFDTNKKEGKKR